jgi:hypothetical protein
MEPDNDPGSPYYNKVPVTPVMDFQIDSITIHKILLPLRKQVLQELQKKVLENRRKDFMEIFLTMYILLHNIELTIAHDRWFAQRWNVKVWGSLLSWTSLPIGRKTDDSTATFLALRADRQRLPWCEYHAHTLPLRNEGVRSIRA